MNRRNFLRGLGAVVGAAALAKVPFPKLSPPPSVGATIGQYADYISFHDAALETAIDDAVRNVGTEMSRRLVLTLNTLVQNTADEHV